MGLPGTMYRRLSSATENVSPVKQLFYFIFMFPLYNIIIFCRNLYFRTCFLVLHDVQMVFVLEGKAPTLKYKTIAARNDLQFKGAAPKAPQTQRAATTVKKGNTRSRFDGILKQCKEMLTLMGLACVTGQGEAEAMCAHLNKQKVKQSFKLELI